MIIPCGCNERSLLLITSSQGYLVVSLESMQEAHPRMTRSCIHQLIYLRQGERILWASLIYVCEVYTHPPFPIFLLHHHRVGQPLGVKHFLYGPNPFKFEHYFLDNIRMFSGQALRWLLFGEDRWNDVWMVTNEVWIHPKGLVSTPCKHDNVFF